MAQSADGQGVMNGSSELCVRYYGHVGLVVQSDPLVVNLRSELNSLQATLNALSSRRQQDPDWKQLANDVVSAMSFLEQSSFPLYKLQLLDSVLKYIKRIPDRADGLFTKGVDKSRFAQLNQTLYILTRQEPQEPHPAQVLAVKCSSLLKNNHADVWQHRSWI